jgi:hypothetical protein
MENMQQILKEAFLRAKPRFVMRKALKTEIYLTLHSLLPQYLDECHIRRRPVNTTYFFHNFCESAL